MSGPCLSIGEGVRLIMSPVNLLNAVLCQGARFACVLGGAAGSSLWGANAVSLRQAMGRAVGARV